LLTIAKVKPYKSIEKIYWCGGGMDAARWTAASRMCRQFNKRFLLLLIFQK